MNTLFEVIKSALALGADARTLTFFQIAIRGVIVFFVTLVMLRLGDRRFLSNKSAFDAVLGFILASMLARAVNGTSAFFPTLGGGFVLVGLHRLLARLTRDPNWLGTFIKGQPDVVIQDGTVNKTALKQNNLSEQDLLEDMRLNGNANEPGKIKTAYFERNGQISVVKD
jgi:uncharacterized membrane protein YcaP (DUF421 family)